MDPSAFYKLMWGIGIVSGMVAAAITAVLQLLGGWRERVAANRRHLRDLALRAAVVQWEHEVAEARKANQPTRLMDVDFDMILVRKLQMIEIFGKGRLSEKRSSTE
jgi:hypothetical protein